jgi:hypothetical protein
VYSRQDGGTGRSVTMTSISNTLKETINPRLNFLVKILKLSVEKVEKMPYHLLKKLKRFSNNYRNVIFKDFL